MNVKLTVKPVGDGCNLVCKHCFVGGEPAKTERMSSETLKNTQEKARQFADNVRITWHGGEPLLAGTDFFGEALEMQERLGGFSNTMQSNLTVLDDGTADFLAEHDIHVGTSIDGIKEIHDAYRTYPDGRGSFDDVVAGINRLKERGCRVGAIACYTKYMKGRMMEVYQAFKDLGVTQWRLSPLTKSAREDIGTRPSDFADEMTGMIDVYLFDRDSPIMATIDDYIRQLRNAARNKRLGTSCYNPCHKNAFAVDAKGNAYPCGRFTSDESTCIGNVNDDSFGRILSHPFKREMDLRIPENIRGCSGCEYKTACGTGCANDAWIYSGDLLAHDRNCESMKRIYGHIIQAVAKTRGE